MSCNEWKTSKLGDVADILSGYAFKTKDFIEEGIPVVKIKNIIPPNIDIRDTQYVSDELYNDKIKFALNYNDVLISLTGSNINQLASAVGKIGRVKLKDKKILLNQRVGKLYITDEALCNYDYLYYYLIQPEVRYNLASAAGGSANQANISPSQIKDIEIKLPPLEEQEKIANILSSLDDKIELNNEMNKTLEEMASTLFKRWFVDFEFPNEDGEPYKSSGGEMVDSELGMIPKGWEVKEMGAILELIIDYRGKTPKKLGSDWSESGIMALSAKHIKSGKLVNREAIKYVSKELYEKWMKDKVRQGDIIMTSEAPVGELYYINNNTKYCLSQRVYGLRSNNSILKSSILYYMLASDCIKGQILNRSTGTTVVGIRQTELKKVNILVPTMHIQNKISSILDEILFKNEVVENENNLLSELRDSILPKIMSGELFIK